MNYLEFMPLAQNCAGQLGNLAGTPFAQWATGKNFTDSWGDPADWANTQTPEIYGVDNIDGEQWLTLTMLGAHRIKTVKAIVTREGVAKEIKCGSGHPYALINFVPHSIEIWGLVDDLKFYWKASYRPAHFTNPYLGITRECIEQSEVWGNDDYSGNWSWTRGGPLPPYSKPFHGDNPIPIITESAWFQGIAFGYGPAWVMGEIKDGARVITSCANSTGWGW